MTPTVMDDFNLLGVEDYNSACMKCTRLETQLAQANNKIKEQEHILEAVKKEKNLMSALVKKMNAQKQHIAKLEKKNQVLEKGTIELKDEVSVSRAQLKKILSQNQGKDISLIEQQLHGANNTVKSLKTQMIQYDVKIANSKVTLEKTEEENKEIKGKIRKLEESVRKLNEKTSEQSEHAKQDTKNEQIKKYQFDVTSLKKQLKRETDKNSSEAVEAQNELVKGLKKELRVLKADNNRLYALKESSISNAADRKNKDIAKELTWVKNSNQRLEKVLAEMSSKINSIQGLSLDPSPRKRKRRSTKTSESAVRRTPAKRTAKLNVSLRDLDSSDSDTESVELISALEESLKEENNDSVLLCNELPGTSDGLEEGTEPLPTPVRCGRRKISSAPSPAKIPSALSPSINQTSPEPPQASQFLNSPSQNSTDLKSKLGKLEWKKRSSIVLGTTNPLAHTPPLNNRAPPLRLMDIFDLMRPSDTLEPYVEIPYSAKVEELVTIPISSIDVPAVEALSDDGLFDEIEAVVTEITESRDNEFVSEEVFPSLCKPDHSAEMSTETEQKAVDVVPDVVLPILSKTELPTDSEQKTEEATVAIVSDTVLPSVCTPSKPDLTTEMSSEQQSDEVAVDVSDVVHPILSKTDMAAELSTKAEQKGEEEAAEIVSNMVLPSLYKPDPTVEVSTEQGESEDKFEEVTVEVLHAVLPMDTVEKREESSVATDTIPTPQSTSNGMLVNLLDLDPLIQYTSTTPIASTAPVARKWNIPESSQEIIAQSTLPCAYEMEIQHPISCSDTDLSQESETEMRSDTMNESQNEIETRKEERCRKLDRLSKQLSIECVLSETKRCRTRSASQSEEQNERPPNTKQIPKASSTEFKTKSPTTTVPVRGRRSTRHAKKVSTDTTVVKVLRSRKVSLSSSPEKRSTRSTKSSITPLKKTTNVCKRQCGPRPVRNTVLKPLAISMKPLSSALRKSPILAERSSEVQVPEPTLEAVPAVLKSPVSTSTVIDTFPAVFSPEPTVTILGCQVTQNEEPPVVTTPETSPHLVSDPTSEHFQPTFHSLPSYDAIDLSSVISLSSVVTDDSSVTLPSDDLSNLSPLISLSNVITDISPPSGHPDLSPVTSPSDVVIDLSPVISLSDVITDLSPPLTSSNVDISPVISSSNVLPDPSSDILHDISPSDVMTDCSPVISSHNVLLNISPSDVTDLSSPGTQISAENIPPDHSPLSKRKSKRKRNKPPSLKNIFTLYRPTPLLERFELLRSRGTTPDADLEIDIDGSDDEFTAEFRQLHQTVETETPLSYPVVMTKDSSHRLRVMLNETSERNIPSTAVDKGDYLDFSLMRNHQGNMFKSLKEVFKSKITSRPQDPDYEYVSKTILHNKDILVGSLGIAINKLIKDELSAPKEVEDQSGAAQVFLKLCRTMSHSKLLGDVNIYQLVTYNFFAGLKITKADKKSTVYFNLLKFGIEFSVRSGQLEEMRSFVISLILKKDKGTFHLLQQIMTQCFSQYSPLVLIGREQLGYDDNDNLMTIPSDSIYLAGLEFYLRFTLYREYSAVERLRYVHQYAIEGHLISLALTAVMEEGGEEPSQTNKQGLLCLHLMMRSQGWSWLVTTLLPQIFHCMESGSEYSLCRLIEAVADLASVEISYQRADVQLIKNSLIPTLHGLLWTAPTINIKRTLADGLLKFAPVDPMAIIEIFDKWLPTIQNNPNLVRSIESKVTFLKQKNKLLIV